MGRLGLYTTYTTIYLVIYKSRFALPGAIIQNYLSYSFMNKRHTTVEPGEGAHINNPSTGAVKARGEKFK